METLLWQICEGDIFSPFTVVKNKCKHINNNKFDSYEIKNYIKYCAIKKF